jgi:hypothetical protein
VKLSLAAKELESNPENILEKIPEAVGLAKGMAKELINVGQIYLPCSLDLPLLEAICAEIKQISGVIENKHQFARALPKLTKYLNGYPVYGLNNANQWMEKLAAVAGKLERVLDTGEIYSGRWAEFIQTYMLGRDYKRKLEKDAMQSAPDELDQYLEETRIRRGQKPLKTESAPLIDPDLISDSEQVEKQLELFKKLHESYQQAHRLNVQYQEIKELMLRAISLPTSESDLLMRYQTTLERRLSSAIGELLALQRSPKP